MSIKTALENFNAMYFIIFYLLACAQLSGVSAGRIANLQEDPVGTKKIIIESGRQQLKSKIK
jgi:hypothetical protein